LLEKAKFKIIKLFRETNRVFCFKSRCNIFNLNLKETDNLTIFEYFKRKFDAKVKFDIVGKIPVQDDWYNEVEQKIKLTGQINQVNKAFDELKMLTNDLEFMDKRKEFERNNFVKKLINDS
jgi:hypothetical protein